MIPVLFIIFSYLLGSIPFGFILTKAAGLGDIRQIGSGNIGATNVFRTGNKVIGCLTFALDVIKGFVPVYIAMEYGIKELHIYACGLAAVCGHVFPIWLKFKGGKGVATSLGVTSAVMPYMALFLAAVWLIMFAMYRTSSLASISAVLVGPAFGLYTYGWKPTVFGILLAAIILYRHKSNIERILNGKELNFTKRNKDK